MDLTNPGLAYDQSGIDPITGMPIALPPMLRYFKNPDLRNQQFAQDVHAALPASQMDVSPSSVASVTDGGKTTQGEVLPPNLQFSGGEPSFQPTLPKMFKPSFRSVSSGPEGTPAPVNPAETKLGKLLHIVMASARGALAGSEGQNFGQGVQLADSQPYVDAQRKQQMVAGNLANQTTAANLSALPIHLQMIRSQLANEQAQTRLRAAQEEAYISLANKRDTPPEEIYNVKLQLAQKYGLDPEQTRQFVFGVTPTKDLPEPKGQTVEVGNKIMQYNPKTQRYDINVGPVSSKSGANRPTADEFRYNLWKRDPQAYASIYGNEKDKVQTRNNLLRYRQELVQQMNSGMVEDDQLQTIQQTVQDIDGELSGSFGNKQGGNQKFKFTQQHAGATYGRNSETEPWKKISDTVQ